jgi:hypothetical protein
LEQPVRQLALGPALGPVLALALALALQQLVLERWQPW